MRVGLFLVCLCAPNAPQNLRFLCPDARKRLMTGNASLSMSTIMLRNTVCFTALVLASVVGCGFENPYSGPVADAYLAFGRGDTKGALRQLDQIIRKQPTPGAYQLRATIRITSADYRGAVVDATNGLKLDPTNVYLKGLKEEAETFEQSMQQVKELRDAQIKFDGIGDMPSAMGNSPW
jgi:hypothetical protein